MNDSRRGHPATDKAALRRQLREARRADPAPPGSGVAIRDAALAWEPLRSARVVAAYASVGTEPDTRPLLDELHARGVEVLLPVVLPDLDLDWALHEPGTMQAVRGLDEPTGARLGVEAIRTADLVIAPGLAVSPSGARLGQGGGYYDRALARLPHATPVAVVVHPREVGVDVPTEPHDRPVTHVLTVDGVSVLG